MCESAYRAELLKKVKVSEGDALKDVRFLAWLAGSHLA